MQQLKNTEQEPSNVQTCNTQQQTLVPYMPLQINTNLQQQQSFGKTSQQVNVSATFHVKVKKPKAHKQSFLKLMGFTSGQQQIEQNQQILIQSQQHQYQQQYVPQYALQGYNMSQQQQQKENVHYQPQMQFHQPKVQYQPQM